MLTIQDLKDLKPGIFARGMVQDNPLGANMANTGNLIKWVAVRGSIHDWAIYCDNPYEPMNNFEEVASSGDKIHNQEIIKRLIPCDKEAFEMYRY